MPSSKRLDAFTLIELLLVVGVIGLLATLVAVGLSSARAKSRDTKRATDLKQIQKAIELSYDPTSGYPVVSSPLVIGAAATDVLCAKGAVVGFVADQTTANCDAGRLFMGLVPMNPSPNGASYTYKSTNGAGAVCITAPCNGYCVQTTLERGLPQSDLSSGPVIGDQAALKNGVCP